MNHDHKRPLLAFFLAVVPGLGHLYWNRPVRAVLYAFGFFGFLFGGVALSIVFHDNDPLVVSLLAVPIWFVNMLDMIVTLLRQPPAALAAGDAGEALALAAARERQNERFLTILLALFPGLGHFQLGLMNRGLSFLLAFFGLIMMVLFVAGVTGREVFLVFLAGLPVIWLYSLFDAVQLVTRKQRGEEILDRTIFEELAEGRETGRKSKAAAAFLSVVPGAGHMYLGLQRRGFQLMAGFLLTIYILDVLRLSLFLFLVPLLWFYSFFDALQHASRIGREPAEDVPVVSGLVHRQKWLGVGLLALGAFHLLDQVVLPIVEHVYPNLPLEYWMETYFQTTLVSVLLIGGGIKLLMGTKRERGGGTP